MPTLNEVYRKFGEVSEAAQLLETELGTLLLNADCLDADLFEKRDVIRAREIYDKVNRKTLGQLIKTLSNKDSGIDELEHLLRNALNTRNRLAHSYFLRHNLRRNSSDGCEIMLSDLEKMHEILLEAYKAIMLLSGVDLDKIAAEESHQPQPTDHLPI